MPRRIGILHPGQMGSAVAASIRNGGNEVFWASEGRSTYNALQIDFNRRFNAGLSLRGVYTLAKAMDDGDSLNATAANNAVALLSNPFNPRADWGPATYDVRNAASINARRTAINR